MDELKEYLRDLMGEYGSQPNKVGERFDSFPEGSRTRPMRPGEWSPHQVLAHLEAADAMALRPRLQRIMEEERPHLPEWDEVRWMRSEYDREAAAADLIVSMAEGRRAILEPMAQLPLTEWNRSGIHPRWGERTLLWWLEYSVHHVWDHLDQLNIDQTQRVEQEA